MVRGFPPGTTTQASSALVGIEFWNASQEFWGFGDDEVIGPIKR
jgi:hypothetical protein